MNDLTAARYRQLVALLKEAGYKRDDLRCQWVRADRVVRDEVIVYMADLETK